MLLKTRRAGMDKFEWGLLFLMGAGTKNGQSYWVLASKLL